MWNFYKNSALTLGRLIKNNCSVLKQSMSSITGVWLESSGNQSYSHRYPERLENAAPWKFIKKCNFRVFLLGERINRIKIRGSLASSRSVAEQKICRKKEGYRGSQKGTEDRKLKEKLYGRKDGEERRASFYIVWKATQDAWKNELFLAGVSRLLPLRLRNL